MKKQSRILKLGQKHKSVNILILQQILEEEQHQKEGIEVTEAEINTYKKIILKDTECSVCGEDLKAGDQHLVFQCKHAFHQECLIEWLKIKNSCPTCRQKMIPIE